VLGSCSLTNPVASIRSRQRRRRPPAPPAGAHRRSLCPSAASGHGLAYRGRADAGGADSAQDLRSGGPAVRGSSQTIYVLGDSFFWSYSFQKLIRTVAMTDNGLCRAGPDHGDACHGRRVRRGTRRRAAALPPACSSLWRPSHCGRVHRWVSRTPTLLGARGGSDSVGKSRARRRRRIGEGLVAEKGFATCLTVSEKAMAQAGKRST
jgi:hypothetical protein